MNGWSMPMALGMGALAIAFPVSSACADGTDKAKAEAFACAASKFVQHGDYDQGCALYAESARVDPSARRILKVAECNERRGLIATAWITASEARDMAEVRNEPTLARVAQKRGTRLETKLGRIEIDLAAGADVEGLEIRRDGLVVSRALYNVAVAADPGPHVVSVSAPGRHPWSAEIGLSPGKMTVKVVVPALEGETGAGARGPLRSLPSKPPAALVEGERGAAQRRIAWVVGGVGVAGLAVGTYFGLRAQSTHAELADGPCNTGTCVPSATGQLDTFRAQSTAATVFFTMGAAAVIGGLVTYFTAPPAKPADERPSLRLAPTVAPGIAGVTAVGKF
jgi:hypothetical protein